MKYFEKISEYKEWDDRHAFTENIPGGAAIGAFVGPIAAKLQAQLINRKLKAIEEIKPFKPALIRASIIGGLLGSIVGAGKYVYEKEYYTK
ncbi:hypothetical protein AYK24_00155 [Thermoplasmatales archaeon SG8-52-4]|nr:MAG: hypothetical protein AYK24_00155 [Thermoplasmatales archaeon SG8-52-4]